MRKTVFLLVIVCLTASYAGATLTSGLVAYWPFDSDPNDYAGTNHGTFVGSPSYVEGRLGQAIALSSDGTLDYVAFDTTSDGLTGAWTAAAWVNVHRQDTGGFLDGYFGDPAEDDCYGLRFSGQFGATSNPGMTDYPTNVNAAWDGTDSQTQAYTPPLDTWMLLVFAGSDTQCELFADGVSQGTVVYAETKGTHGDSDDEEDEPMQFKLTWDRLGDIVKYSGYGDSVVDYDEVAIWDRNLTYEEIQDMWNCGQGTRLLPEMASIPRLPYPVNCAEAVDPGVILTWQAPGLEGELTYDVYMDTSDANSPAPDGQGISATSYTPVSELLPDTTYYWRVDVISLGDGGPTTSRGDVWSFTTLPATANKPNPASDTTNVARNAVLSFSAGLDSEGNPAELHELFCDPNEALVIARDPSVSKGQLTETAFDPDLEWGTQYFWVVDELYDGGAVAPGEVWNFTVAKRLLWDPLPGDENDDGLVNFADLAVLAENWLMCSYINDDCP